MIHADIIDFINAINNRSPLKLDACRKFEGRILGLDMGQKKIGIALSDISLTIASPMEIMLRHSYQKDIAKLLEIIKEHNICGIVIGLPINMQGLETENCALNRVFAKKLLEHIAIRLPAEVELCKRSIEILFRDERLSTSVVNRMLSETKLTRKKRNNIDDKIAACYILQGALDQMNYITAQNSSLRVK